MTQINVERIVQIKACSCNTVCMLLYIILPTLDVYTTTYVAMFRIMAVVVINNFFARLKCFQTFFVHA